MSLPTFTFEVGFASDPLYPAPSFTDLASDLESLSISRGRQTDDDAASTGTATGVLNDDARKYDPDNAAGAYYPNVQPMKPVRIRAILDGTTYAVFYGWIDTQTGWIRAETEPSRATVTVPCNDGFDILANGRVFTRSRQLDYVDAVRALAPVIYWRLNEAAGVTVAADSAGSGLTGTYGSGTTRGGAAAPINDPSAFSTAFNNTSNGVVSVTGVSYAFQTKFTAMGWAKRTSTADADPLVGYPSSYPSLCLSSGSGDVTWQPASGATGGTWTAAWPGTGAWVHWALTWDNSTKTAELFINGASQGTRALSTALTPFSNSFTVGAGADTSGVGAWWNGSMDEVAFYNYVLASASIAGVYAARLQAPPSIVVPVTGCDLSQELTGSRIGRILGIDVAAGGQVGMWPQWPTAWRSLDTGLATVQAQVPSDNASTDPASLIQGAVTTEPGFFFFDKSGYATFRNRRSRLLATSQATFCDSHNLSGGRILYDSITTRRTAIVNVAQVTRTGGTQQESVDSASQTSLMSRAKSYSTLHVDDATALEMAKWVVGQKKDSYEVLESLTLVPGTDSPTWVQVLSRELGDRITVVRTPPGGGASSTLDYFIEKIDLTWGPGPDAKCTWRLTPATQFNYWLAGTAGSSEAGTTTRAAY